MIGMSEERKASDAEAVAIGIAKRVTHLIPHRFNDRKSKTMAQATACTGRFRQIPLLDGRCRQERASARTSAPNPTNNRSR